MKNFFAKLKLLWEIFGPFRPVAIVLLFLIIIGSVAESFSLVMIMPFLEEATKVEKASGITHYLAPFVNRFPLENRIVVIVFLIFTLILFKNLLYVLRIALSSRFVWRLRERWMKRIMERYLYAPYHRIISDKQGVLLNNLITEPTRSATSLKLLIDFTAKTILSIALYVVLLSVSWKVTIILTLILAIVVVSINKITHKYSTGVGARRLKLSQELTALGTEIIGGIRQVKTFTMETKSSRIFSKALDSLSSMLIKFDIIKGLPQPAGELLIIGGFLIILSYLTMITHAKISSIIPILGVFVIVSQRLFSNLATLYTQRINILSLLPSLKLVHELSSMKDYEQNIDTGVPVKSLQGDIVIDNVHFSYTDSKQLFKGLSMTLSYGRVTALIGGSGSGKSTIADLLIGLYHPYKGRVLVNGIDIKEINLQSWRRLVGFVSQDTFLLNATIKENILVGKPDATDEEIRDAAKKANADNFILGLPEGFNTLIGDRGVKLSGGQRQRIAIARAIIRNPGFLIFDEATSSLDTESERMIQKSIEELGRNKTVFVIAHRLSTIQNADFVYKLKNGRIEKITDKRYFEVKT